MSNNVPLHPADLLDTLNEIVFQTDPHGNWTYLNQAWTRVTGFPVRDSLGRNFLEYVHPEERQRTIELFTAVVSGRAAYCHHEGRYLTAGGRSCWLELRASVRYDESGQMLGNAGTMFDVTARREAQELLDEQTAILELIAQDAALPHILGPLASLLARFSGAAVSVVTSSTASGLMGARKRDGGDRADRAAAVRDLSGAWMLMHATPDGTVEHTLSPTPNQLAAPGTGARRLPQIDYPIRSSVTDTELGWFVLEQEASLPLDTRVQQVADRCVRLACIAIARAHSEDRVRRQALEDPLTGLPNRALLWDRFGQALAGARRSGLLIGVVLFDLDHFKDINDKFGHVVGDRTLQAVAAQIGASIRGSDTLARLGGDEFALVMPGLKDVKEAEQITSKALTRLEDELRVDHVVLKLNASVGIAMYPAHGSDPTSLLRRADVAMYRAKRLGGGRIAVYDPVVDQEELESLAFIAELQHAIDADELVLHYQPKVNLRTGDTVGAECLVRWQHPSRGMLPPSKFIPLAESTGLVKPLTVWVMRRALEDSLDWQAQGLKIPVAVNLSAPLLHDAELPHAIDQALRACPECRLELEITESAVMQDPEGAMKTIGLLRGLGIAFSLDDFGTGYSSLAYLKNLQVQAIKIDRSFVRDMVTDGRDASIVRAAIELGHNFCMFIVAEGVESQPISELLTSLDCDYAQGFHFAPPMPSAMFLGWNRDRQEDHHSAPH